MRGFVGALRGLVAQWWELGWESGNLPPVRPLSGHQPTAAIGGNAEKEKMQKKKYEVLGTAPGINLSGASKRT